MDAGLFSAASSTAAAAADPEPCPRQAAWLARWTLPTRDCSERASAFDEAMISMNLVTDEQRNGINVARDEAKSLQRAKPPKADPGFSSISRWRRSTSRRLASRARWPRTSLAA